MSSIGNLNIVPSSVHNGFTTICEVDESRSHIRRRATFLLCLKTGAGATWLYDKIGEKHAVEFLVPTAARDQHR
jgi:hypothetical protein